MNYLDLLPFLLLGLCDFDEEDYYKIEHSAALVKAELDKLTKLLCEAGKVFSGKKKPSKALLKWWGEHEKRDERRKK
jgi:hypothetical protein